MRFAWICAVTLLLTGCVGSQIIDIEPHPQPKQEFPELNALPVKGRAPKSGYSREAFGERWSDNVTVDGGHNGCDTRNDILGRDLVNITFKPGTRDCLVLSGTLQDPYTNTQIAFERGEATSPLVQIDHVVSLSNAWQTGAQYLTPEQRQDFANDPRNLLAVDGPANQQKSDGDAATWLPPNAAFRCEYVQRQIEVKANYGLWVTPPEKEAMARVLASCGQQQVPADPIPAPSQEDSNMLYPDCKAARAAGAAPIYRGQPGYRPEMDGDGDGIACESAR